MISARSLLECSLSVVMCKGELKRARVKRKFPERFEKLIHYLKRGQENNYANTQKRKRTSYIAHVVDG